DPAQSPPSPKMADGWQFGKPDLVLEAPTGYVLPAQGTDVYHNFIFQVAVTDTHYVRAVEIHPGNTMVVHHANLLIDRMHSAQRQQARSHSPGPGFDGMDVEMESDAFEPEGHFIYWKPGTPVWVERDDMAWRLSPGTDLVLNIHLRPSGMPEPVRPTIALYFSDRVPKVKPMLLQLDRDDALNIPPGVSDFKISDDFKLPVDVQVFAVYPHAHYLGKELDAYATLPGGARKWLLRIADWDPAWQGVYRYREPVRLPRGTVISMRYTYDNSSQNPRNPNQPPQRVTAGNRSTDEMAHLFFQVVPIKPAGGRDGRLILQEALMRHKLEHSPEDYAANYNLGALLLSGEQPGAAIEYLTRAVHQRSDSAPALNSLGAALLQAGRMEAAVERFRQAVESDPAYVDAHYNLASALATSGEFAESAKEFAVVVQHQPGDAEAEARLGSVLAALRDYDAAETHFRRSLSLDPNNEVAKENLRLLQQVRSTAH
ncbi:MAG TPA: tetratricopeptide repeat protein, partial [Terriglobales bacterium]|nr:tetratricopeptide repeat protein [Terriglobales bacterium]